MEITVLGATGRTGRLVVAEALRRGHGVTALVRDPATAALPPEVVVHGGDVRDAGALAKAVAGAGAVVSALGPRAGDATLHRDVAAVLVGVLRDAGVRRFVGVSGAGIAVPGDAKSARDRLISAIVRRFGGAAVADKAEEHAIWAASGTDWTLVRPPRLSDAEATGRVEHHAHRSPRATAIGRADLAAFLLDCAEQGLHVGAAPLVGRG
ncbi:MAG: NAD(P)H-binding protein [Pseudonocardiales bacterium]|jgi:putative NADH-flavin reductase|nr:NAD(P)H-binding protein [Pseudonocardiales bacterium]